MSRQGKFANSWFVGDTESILEPQDCFRIARYSGVIRNEQISGMETPAR